MFQPLSPYSFKTQKNPPSQINQESGIQEMERSSFFLPSIVAFLVLVFKIQSYPTEQQVKDRVHGLPGQGSFNVSFGHYSGYVTVNKDSGRALFYWFFEAPEDPSSKPLAIWLQGGPGCSSIGYGMGEEIGPFHIKPDGKTLYLNTYAWNQVANIIFIDSPVGVGFSYSNNSQDVITNGDKRTAEDALAFLYEWLERFPQYKGRDFYITGESYAGHYIPQLAQAIVRSQMWMKEKPINLKGFLVGNPLTDDFYDYLGAFQYLWTIGLISDESYKLLNLFCDWTSFLQPSPECKTVHDLANKELGNIDIYSIFTPSCTENAISNQDLKRSHSFGHIGEEYDPCTLNHSTIYFNLPEVQEALHIIQEKAPTKWLPCSHEVNINWKDTARSVLPIYKELIYSGLRIWVFSGNADTVIPVTSTRYSIDALNLPTLTPWHAWYDDGQVGGWIQEYKGLTFVTVRGAGHEVPKFRPKLALVLLKAFLSGNSLPTLSEHRDS
eukprot:TRINITY_DN983_c0_g1_i3.p1 TRINITY_DN983_c0_g1~~TRINITY_DN983_c0_g1_i3.p1  ORF type:complete len:495 (-),score=94.37 TRINITY_DN983_c0_g1_i3:507-1991(-)